MAVAKFLDVSEEAANNMKEHTVDPIITWPIIILKQKIYITLVKWICEISYNLLQMQNNI